MIRTAWALLGVIFLLLFGGLACATLRAPGDPAPTPHPSLSPPALHQSGRLTTGDSPLSDGFGLLGTTTPTPNHTMLPRATGPARLMPSPTQGPAPLSENTTDQ